MGLRRGPRLLQRRDHVICDPLGVELLGRCCPNGSTIQLHHAAHRLKEAIQGNCLHVVRHALRPWRQALHEHTRYSVVDDRRPGADARDQTPGEQDLLDDCF